MPPSRDIPTLRQQCRHRDDGGFPRGIIHPAVAAVAAVVPTVILTESTATSAGSLPLGSQQQGNLHQVHQQQQQQQPQPQQQQSRQRVNLIADVPVNDVTEMSDVCILKC
ncbi:PREDICTED: regulatory protein zeste-like [Acromyrmex echinatior]|uniref:regulatory protein zeste-like n=1 Tax=Acromyrmex echinatior TaxID=103372 RepID=UPI000580E1D3|nr:PREDICTED: regulatory protein zeste-like [Acromyrmex echinatior]